MAGSLLGCRVLQGHAQESLSQAMYGLHYLRPDLHSGCVSLHPYRQCGRAHRPSTPPFVVLQKQKTTNGGVGGAVYVSLMTKDATHFKISSVFPLFKIPFGSSVCFCFLFCWFPCCLVFCILDINPSRRLAGKGFPVLRLPLHLLDCFLLSSEAL